MTRVYYVDVAIPADKKKRRKHKTHAVFDGGRVFRIGRLTELEDAGEIYVDALFPELYDEILELLRRGVRVYLLKDVKKLKKLRMENNSKKTDETDAMLLARIPMEKFRQLTIEELEIKKRVRPLINEYEQVMRWKKTLKRLIKRGFDYNFKESIRLMKRDSRRLSKEIIEQMMTLPEVYKKTYKEACKILGIKNNSTELAILVIELPLHLPLVRLRGLLGMIPGRNRGKYDHRLRSHIASFAATLYMNAKRRLNVSDMVVDIVNRLPKEQAIYRLELITLKALRIAYLMAAKSLAGG